VVIIVKHREYDLLNWQRLLHPRREGTYTMGQEFLSGGAALTLLAIVAVLLVGILVALIGILRRPPASVVDGLWEAVAELNRAVRHHVEVNAVLALVDNYQERPQALENLRGYSRQVVAAALTFRLNSLSAQHQSLESGILQDRQIQAAAGTPSIYDRRIAELQERADQVLERLLAELEPADN
jgi:hypothetical protein